MYKTIIFLTLACSFSTLSTANTKNTVLYFHQSVTVCDGSSNFANCSIKQRSELPDPQKTIIEVKEITDSGIVKLMYENNVIFVLDIDLELSVTAKVSKPCKSTYKTSSPEKRTYATHGVRKDCKIEEVNNDE